MTSTIPFLGSFDTTNTVIAWVIAHPLKKPKNVIEVKELQDTNDSHLPIQCKKSVFKKTEIEMRVIIKISNSMCSIRV